LAFQGLLSNVAAKDTQIETMKKTHQKTVIEVKKVEKIRILHSICFFKKNRFKSIFILFFSLKYNVFSLSYFV